MVKLDKDQGPEIDIGLEIKIVEDNVKKTEVYSGSKCSFLT